MAAPKNKEELQKAIAENYAKLKKELDIIPGQIASIQELEGHSKGTLMSVNDLIFLLLHNLKDDFLMKHNHRNTLI